MKKCLTCGRFVQDDNRFCPYCGQASFEIAAPVQPAQQYIPAQQNYQSAPASAKATGKGKKPLIVALAVITVIAIAIGSVSAFAASRLNSPLVKLINGVTEIISSGKTYAVDGTYDDEYVCVDINGKLSIDPESGIAVAQGTLTEGGEMFGATGYIDREQGKVIGELSMVEFGTPCTLGILNDIFYESGYSDSAENAEEIYDYTVLIAGYILELIPLIDDVKSIDTQAVADLANRFFDDMNWEYSKIYADEVAQIIDILKDDLSNILTSKKWAEEHLGYESSKGVDSYSFTLDEPVSEFVAILNENDEIYDIGEIGETIEEFALDYEYEEEYYAQYKIDLEVEFDGGHVSAFDFIFRNTGYDGKIRIHGTVEESSEPLTVGVEAYDALYEEKKSSSKYYF